MPPVYWTLVQWEKTFPMISFDPMQHVAHNRPTRFARRGLLTQYPMAVERVDGAIAALQFDPSIDESEPILIAPGYRIGERNFHNPRLGHDNGILWIE